MVNAFDLSSAKPSPEGKGWVRGNKNKEKIQFISPHPSLLPEGEGVRVLKSTKLRLLVPCSELEVIEDFYDAAGCERLYQRLLHEQNWPDNRYVVAGRQFILPRLQTWHADPGIRYSYSNNLLETRSWTPLLSDIKAQVESILNFSFNSVLVNLYRNGDDYVGWHADNEPELGEQPFIASLTFGAERQFEFRHKKSSEHGRILLRSGALLIMQPDFQHHWLHRVPIDKNVKEGRINLTFRKVIPASTVYK